jgi:hypothetical protein
MPFVVGAQMLLIIAYASLFSKAEDVKSNVALSYFAADVACVGCSLSCLGVMLGLLMNWLGRRNGMS